MFFRLIRLSVLLSFVGAEREENLIRNDPDKSEFTSGAYVFSLSENKGNVHFLVCTG